jgi:tetratricopeptide (TPR) repeat protein
MDELNELNRNLVVRGAIDMKKQSPTETQSWLEQAYPQMHFLLLALDGDERASRWLEKNSPGVALFARSLAGDEQALAKLENGSSVDLDDLFEMIDNEDLVNWLEQRQPNLHLLFEAIQGNDEAVGQVKRRKAAYAQLIGPFRAIHEAYEEKIRNGNGAIEGGAAADMGCLIGEMHLHQGEYEKAIEAFTRAIETQPAADVYEGRARAYRGLAALDESSAKTLRQRSS